MLESKFQADLIKKIKNRFEGCEIFKTDPTYKQGSPDLLILYKDKWAALECKKSKSASHRPNQDYYVDKFNGMSYAAFVYPENEEEVLNDIQRSFETRRSSRPS